MTISIGCKDFPQDSCMSYPTLGQRIKLGLLPVPEVTEQDFKPGLATLVGECSFLQVPAFTPSYTIWGERPFPYLISFALLKDENSIPQITITALYLEEREVEAFKAGMARGIGKYERLQNWGEATKWAQSISEQASAIKFTQPQDA